MDAYDLFRKLRVGTKFDVKRFENDALRCQIIKESANKLTPSIKKSVPAINSSVDDDSKKHLIKKSKKRKRKASQINLDDTKKQKSELLNEDGLESSDDEIHLTSSIKSTDRGNIRKKKKSLKGKKKLSLKKLRDLKREQINHFRKEHRIFVTGEDVSDPIEAFSQLVADYGVEESLLEAIMHANYTTPTPIQMQAIPVMLNRREILACAPTGSGKTVAFLIPIFHHLKVPKKESYRAVIVEPTRELAKQVYKECCRLGERQSFRVHIIDKVSKAIKSFNSDSSPKFDILVTTPNRLIYLLNHEPSILDLSNVEWLIIDESDKLFEAGKMGFRDQMAIIYKACNSRNVRRAMFSATFAYDVEEWCKLNLDNVVTVSIGARNSAVDTVEQKLMFVGSESGKLLAFRELVMKGLTPPVLVFVQSKERAKELFNELIYDGINVDVIHSDRTQLQRDNVVKAFREGKIWVLICTEVLGRGIDFKGVSLVINYDFPPSAVSYIHRIGRTGRAGRSGKAITYFTEDDCVNLRSIAQVIKSAGCPVPDYMMQLPKAHKQVKRKLMQRAPARDSISTIPLYDQEKTERKKHFIKMTLKQKSATKQKLSSGDT